MRKTFIILVGVLLGGFVFYLVRFTQFYNAIYHPKSNVVRAESLKKVQPKNIYNILLLGYGGPGHDGPYLTDTIILLHIDKKLQKATIISIARDTWVEVPTKSGSQFGSKINALYEMGLYPNDFPDINNPTSNNLQLIENAIASITGLTVDNYIGIDFNAFKKIVDIVGGLDINVKTSFTDKEYPIEGKETDLCGKQESDLPDLEKIATQSPELAFPCRYETLSFNAGLQHMDGERILKYVRSRHGDNDYGDFGRSARQQIFLDALKEKVFSIGFIPKVPDMLNQLQSDIQTDISPSDIQNYLQEALRMKNYKISNLVMTDNDYLDYGTSENGQSILIPKAGKDNWTKVKEWISTSMQAGR